MNKLALTAALGAACLGLAACSNDAANETNAAANTALDTGAASETDGTGDATASTGFRDGSRIVVEDNVTYRVDADGTRVRLGPNESRIVVEGDTRYRVDPDGTRVRINREGAVIDLPDVDVGINEKGNLDVDVGDRDPDGGR